MSTETMIKILLDHETARLQKLFPANNNQPRLVQYKAWLTSLSDEELIAEIVGIMACSMG